jgi:hypothetical protein
MNATFIFLNSCEYSVRNIVFQRCHSLVAVRCKTVGGPENLSAAAPMYPAAQLWRISPSIRTNLQQSRLFSTQSPQQVDPSYAARSKPVSIASVISPQPYDSESRVAPLSQAPSSSPTQQRRQRTLGAKLRRPSSPDHSIAALSEHQHLRLNPDSADYLSSRYILFLAVNYMLLFVYFSFL